MLTLLFVFSKKIHRKIVAAFDFSIKVSRINWIVMAQKFSFRERIKDLNKCTKAFKISKFLKREIGKLKRKLRFENDNY